mmetsp:Transcript_40516/g.52179  ORF Transcript_40516/g.52179 Transcript_40516/m.52179 type:complete len:343 (-) Transcript_40516:763-1791(-)
MGASLSMSDCIPCTESYNLDELSVLMETQLDKVSVFVRVRPLTVKEISAGEENLPGLLSENSNLDALERIAYNSGNVSVGDFTGVLGPSCSNEDVFNLCFAPHLSTVLRGGSSTFFAHGYTGGGKTHTVLGYGDERGVFSLAAERILFALGRKEITQNTSNEKLFLHATACEIYNDKVYDLLSPSKIECSLRIDESGEMVISGPLSSEELPLEDSGIQLISEKDIALGGIHATLITAAKGLHSIPVKKLSHLNEMASRCIQERTAGSSTEHAQSSRSHAMLRVEIVSGRLLKARDKLEKAKAMVPQGKTLVITTCWVPFACMMPVWCFAATSMLTSTRWLLT